MVEILVTKLTVAGDLGRRGMNVTMIGSGRGIETGTVTEIMNGVATMRRGRWTATENEVVSVKEMGNGEEIILVTNIIDGLAKSETTASVANTEIAIATMVNMTVVGIIIHQRGQMMRTSQDMKEMVEHSILFSQHPTCKQNLSIR